MWQAVAIIGLVAAFAMSVASIYKQQKDERERERLRKNIKGQELQAHKKDRDALSNADAKRIVGFLNGLREDKDSN